MVHTEELEMVSLFHQNEVVPTPSYHQDPLLQEENNTIVNCSMEKTKFMN